MLNLNYCEPKGSPEKLGEDSFRTYRSEINRSNLIAFLKNAF